MKHVLATEILGTPRPQGSLKIVTSAATGQAFAKNSDTMTAHRNSVVAVLASAWGSRAPLAGPVALKLCFRFARPKSHFGTGRNADVLKASAPEWHAQTPDNDKLCRLIGDALTIAGVLRDDAYISIMRGEKIWTVGNARTELELWEL